MVKESITIRIPTDFETRPIAMLVQIASQYESTVYIEYDDKHVNAKSIMGMMTLALKNGDRVDVVTDGSDEAKAADGLSKYLEGLEVAVGQ